MVDNTQKATATDEYATRHDPFVYFHSIIDDTTLCDTHVVNLDLLPQDLHPRPTRRTTCSSRRTCATTVTTRRALTVNRAA